MLRYVVVVVVLAIPSTLSAVSVTSELGVINGESKEIEFAGKKYDVHRYLGIPYAQPPVGKLRFRKPEPVAPFDGPFNALKDGPVCPQSEFPYFPPISTYGMSEDCLYLNVFVPVQEPDKPSGHAVLFFIHGGGLSLGSGSWTRGDTLGSVGNVIVVTINYRVGLLGLLDMDDDSAPGNMAFLDQHLALHWVNENIEAFGGDKNRVVIFGQSAGAASVSLQMLYPKNKGLFYGVIAESGTPLMPTMYEQNSITVAKAYAEHLNCSTENNDEVLDCLLSCTPDAILDVFQDVQKSGDMAEIMKLAVTPSIDGDFLKSSPFDLVEASKTKKVEEIEFLRSIKLINGINEKEGSMYVVMSDTENSDDFSVSRESMNAQIPGLSFFVFGPTKAAPEVVTKMWLSEYTDWTAPDDPEKLRDQLARFYGDILFNVPGISFSRVHANSSDSDSYIYHYKAFLKGSSMPRPKWLTVANHGDELMPVFGFDADIKFVNFTEYAPPEWEIDLSTRLMIYWSNFAKTGNPNEPAHSSLKTWPEYELETQEYIIFDKEDSSGQFLYARETDYWKNIIPAVMEAIEHPETISSTYSSGQDETCSKDGNCGGE